LELQKNYLITSTYEDAQVLRSCQLQELYKFRIYKIPNEYIIFTNNPWYINFVQLNFCGFRFEMKVFNFIYIFYCNKRNVPKKPTLQANGVTYLEPNSNMITLVFAYTKPVEWWSLVTTNVGTYGGALFLN